MRRVLMGLGISSFFFVLPGCKQLPDQRQDNLLLATAMESPPPETFPATTLPLPPRTAHAGAGTVIGIDEEMEKITIAIDSVETLEWAMQRKSFTIDSGLLNRVKSGDTVRFTLAESNGDYVIQDIRRK